MSKYKQGVFIPQKPEKWYSSQIVYRSSWELVYMKWADKNPNVTKIASEEIVIPYYYHIDNKMHRYFPDFIMEFKDKNDNVQTVLVEIKPYKECIAPKKGRKKEQTYINEVLTYEKNMAKWAAAKAWCQDRNMKFVVLTEYELGIKKK